MRTVPTKPKQSNPDVKQAVILFPRPAPKQLKCGQFHAYKLRTTPADAASPIYKLSVPFFDCGTPEEWIKNQTVPHFKLCLDDVAKYVFPEKAGQIQKYYTRRNIRWSKDYTVKEWVARVQELNRYLKDFPNHNRNLTQPLNTDELMDILEFGVLTRWRREFPVQGFDSVDQGLR
eukprot:6832628-Ditylum_brightwellii.AAC.1